MSKEQSQRQQTQAQYEAIQELVTQWGYRDITALVKRVNEQLDAAEGHNGSLPGFDYLCVLQTPEGGPVYCRREQQLFKELEEARAAGRHYDQCPAPDPEKNLWMVIGNFNFEDEEEQ